MLSVLKYNQKIQLIVKGMYLRTNICSYIDVKSLLKTCKRSKCQDLLLQSINKLFTYIHTVKTPGCEKSGLIAGVVVTQNPRGFPIAIATIPWLSFSLLSC